MSVVRHRSSNAGIRRFSTPRGLWARCSAALAALLLLAPARTVAQDRVLTTDRFQIGAGEPVRASVRAASDPAGLLAWPAAEVRWLYVRQVGRQRNYDQASAPAPADRAVTLTLDGAGYAVVGLDTRPLIREMSADELRKAASRAELSDVPLPAEGTLRVAWIESMKLFVVAQPAGASENGDASGAAVVLSKSGQAAEIRFLLNPITNGLDSDVPVITYLRGDRRASRPRATHLASARAIDFDASRGTGHFRIDAPGVWQVEAWFVSPADEGTDAAWAVHHTSAVFEVPPRGGGR